MSKRDILKDMLEKAYTIEVNFENEATFKRFFEVMEEDRKKVLFRLISDSKRHVKILEDLAKRLNLEIELKPGSLDFKGKDLFFEIKKIELGAKSFYEQIASNFSDILGEEAKIFNSLAEEEAFHVELVDQFIDKTERVR